MSLDKLKCPNCGTQMSSEFNKCPVCHGVPVARERAAASATKPADDPAVKYETCFKALIVSGYLILAVAVMLAIVFFVGRQDVQTPKVSLSVQTLELLAVGAAILWGVALLGLHGRWIWAVWLAYILAAPNLIVAALQLYSLNFNFGTIGGFLFNLSIIMTALTAMKQRKELRKREKQRAGQQSLPNKMGSA